MIPPSPEPMNWNEKASEGTERGQPNSWAMGLSPTTTTNVAPPPTSNSATEAIRTQKRYSGRSRENMSAITRPETAPPRRAVRTWLQS
jgi:hypothetical protein